MSETGDFNWDDEGPEFWEEHTFEPLDEKTTTPDPGSKPPDAERALDMFFLYLASLDPEMATILRSCVVMARLPKEERSATVITPSPDTFDLLVANQTHIAKAGQDSGMDSLLLVEQEGNRKHQIYIGD